MTCERVLTDLFQFSWKMKLDILSFLFFSFFLIFYSMFFSVCGYFCVEWNEDNEIVLWGSMAWDESISGCYYDGSSSPDGATSSSSKNIESERNRRKKLNERLFALRAIVPKISKVKFTYPHQLSPFCSTKKQKHSPSCTKPYPSLAIPLPL